MKASIIAIATILAAVSASPVGLSDVRLRGNAAQDAQQGAQQQQQLAQDLAQQCQQNPAQCGQISQQFAEKMRQAAQDAANKQAQDAAGAANKARAVGNSSASTSGQGSSASASNGQGTITSQNGGPAVASKEKREGVNAGNFAEKEREDAQKTADACKNGGADCAKVAQQEAQQDAKDVQEAFGRFVRRFS